MQTGLGDGGADSDHPKLRDVEPVSAGGEGYYLRDPQRISESLLLVPLPVLSLISLFDGTRSRLDIQAEFARRTGEILYSHVLDQIISQLDEAVFLDNDRFARRQAQVVREFHESSSRDATHAGLSYPADPQELRRQLDEVLGGADVEAYPEPLHATALEAVIAPHIDIPRGAACYGAAYGYLARAAAGADTFVILGVSHRPTVRRFAVTTKDYETPLGVLPTNRDFTDRLVKACSHDILTDEIAHRGEHSVEFQALFLRHIFADRDISVVPVLCSSLHHLMAAGVDPESDPEVREFLDALADGLSRTPKVCVIGAVDLSHLGRQFGQEVVVDDAFVSSARADDERMLQRVLERDAGGFYRLIDEEKDRRNVCGVPAIYALLRVIGGSGTADLMAYDQAVDRENHSIVTFASAAFHAAQ